MAVVAAAGPAEQAAGLLSALGSLRHGRWWPPLDEVIGTARRFYPGALADSASALAAGTAGTVLSGLECQTPSAWWSGGRYYGLVIVAVQPVTAGWLGRRDKTATIACGIGFLCLGFGLTALATTTWEYAVCVAIWTLGEILTNATAVALIAGLAPPRLRGRYNGVFGLAFSVGYLIAPIAGTRLLAHGRPVLWLTCAVACAVAAAWQLALGPAIRRREAAAGAGATRRSV